VTEPRNWSELTKTIDESPGIAHMNRSHQRTFSINILQMNALELIQITQNVGDPDEGLHLMMQDNREAGLQTHKEVTRRVHNFVASAFTLVDHTRVFMKEHYEGTPLYDRYLAKVKETFASDPLSQFVQRLRNYMLHKGLPQSEMFLHVSQNPDDPASNTMDTGVKLPTKELLEYKEWGAHAKKFIESCGESVDIRSFPKAYTERVLQHHAWLQFELDAHHKDDLVTLAGLQQEMRAFIAERHKNAPTGIPLETHIQVEDPDVKVLENVETQSLALLAKVKKLEFAADPRPQFKSQRPVGTHITDADMLEQPLYWGPDASGERVFAFVYRGADVFGLPEDDYSEIKSITENILKLDWAAKTLSRKFVEDQTVKWLGQAYGQPVFEKLSDFIQTKAAEAVHPLVLWAPVAHFEVEAPIQFGPVEIRPISAEMLNSFEASFLEGRTQQVEEIKQFIAKQRADIQGLGAVVVKMTAVSERVTEEGAAIAKAAVGLLRYISPAATNPNLICGVSLLGSEHIPSHRYMIIGDGPFSYSEGLDNPYSPAVQLPENAYQGLKPMFDVLGSLVRPEGLSQFAFTVRSAIMIFGTGLTLNDPVDRAAYSLSAMEKLLLIHSAEPIEFNVAERMKLLLSLPGMTPDTDPAKIARDVFRIVSRRDLSPMAPHEFESAAQFSLNAYQVIHLALSNLKTFATAREFIQAIPASAANAKST